MKRVKPKSGQESVWDYPRPPALEPVSKSLRIEHQGVILADTHKGFRVLETSHPPVYYFPQVDLKTEFFEQVSAKQSFCEWKGVAQYWNVRIEENLIVEAGWSYPSPNSRFKAIKDYVAFYPHKFDACYVNDELVKAQAGGFYGGWITDDIVGPFKGEPGTWGW